MEQSASQEQDEVGRELERFVHSLRIRLGEAAVIKSKWLNPRILLTEIVPEAAKACYVSITEMGKNELIVNVGAGGIWELSRSIDSLEFFKSVVESSVRGDVVDTLGLERANTRVTFPDGTYKTTTSRNSLGGIIPTPGWRRWGRKVRYGPYQSGETNQRVKPG
jgi:hypothetical protein